LSTAQSFVHELCELLGVEVPHATAEQSYMFERPITFHHGDGNTSPGRVDCYRRGHFVLESKKLRAGQHTKGFDDALLRARTQAEGPVALNTRRAAEEKTGLIRWLRPAFQDPAVARAAANTLSTQEQTAPTLNGPQADLTLDLPQQPMPPTKPATQQPWPSALPEQVRALAQLLASAPSALPLPAIEAHFKGRGPWKKGLPRILDTLEALGRARREGEGWRG
jgi:hypothetical protein